MTLIHPDEAMQEKIRQELNENVETRNKDLETIKEWLKKQPHLPDEWGRYPSKKKFIPLKFHVKAILLMSVSVDL